MPVTDFLERNVKLYGNETALVELNPEMPETRRMTWKDYDLIQPTTVISCNKTNDNAHRQPDCNSCSSYQKCGACNLEQGVAFWFELELCGEDPE